jgi:hypothetical protein
MVTLDTTYTVTLILTLKVLYLLIITGEKIDYALNAIAFLFIHVYTINILQF